MTTTECRFCLVEHDEATHEATMSLRGWLRKRMALVTAAEPIDATAPKRVEKEDTSRWNVRTEAAKEKRDRSTTINRAKRNAARREQRARNRTPGGGSGWRKYGHVTAEAILERKARGMNQVQIAADLNCAYSLVVRRMMAHRRMGAASPVLP